MSYQYGILRTDDSPEADEHNDRLLGPTTLGFEVIKLALAERCGLGNIDPQHGGDYDSSNSSAIEAALVWPLPPDGTCFVTPRPDRDSLGAMAVITLRANGKKTDERLVRWVGAMDRDGGQNAALDHPELRLGGYATSAMQVIINDPMGVWPTLEEKIEEIGKILTGEVSQETLAAIAVMRRKDTSGFSVEMHGDHMAFIRAPKRYNDARNWGNQRYPVTVICDPSYDTPHGGTIVRWTVVRQNGSFDRQGFERTINEAETQARGMSVTDLERLGYSWGGNKNIVSSPHGRETALGGETILRIVREHAESGIVS